MSKCIYIHDAQDKVDGSFVILIEFAGGADKPFHHPRHDLHPWNVSPNFHVRF